MKAHVSLFAGIGAMDIAAEAAGFTTTACVELDPWCRSILALRFPSARLYADVREVGAADLGVGMDLMSGGFPCQDLSSAGNGAGLEGARSGLWFEFLRLIRECRPQRVLIENVAVLKARGLDIVLKGLAEAGYGAAWDCVPALAVGAPHLRDRVWIDAFRRAAFAPPGAKRHSPDGKMPRAGFMCVAGVHQHVYELPPQATIAQAKAALGAEKRDDGITWLTKLDSPLFPTPVARDTGRSPAVYAAMRAGIGRSSIGSLAIAVQDARYAAPIYPTPSASSYGSNRGGAAGRVGPVRHSLSSMARAGAWPEPVPCFPTPTVQDAKNRGGPAQFQCHSLPLNAAARIWPTPRKGDDERGGRGDLIQVVRDNKTNSAHGGRLWPTATKSDAGRGPGRGSHSSKPGLNLRTATAAGPLNPDWVEWLMGLPIGWTDPDCTAPAQCDWRSECGIPRTATNVWHRKQRLMACGNALVWPVALNRLLQP